MIDWHKTTSAAGELLAKVGLNENPNLLITDIGVGKQQLVEIAKALAKKVKLLILDEPTAALNDDESSKLLALLLELKKQGVTSILISHKLEEIASVSDSITIIRDGKVIETLDNETRQIDQDRIIKSMVGREIVDRFPKRESKIGEVVFQVEDWNVYHPQYEDRKVINDVSLNVRRGEVVGLAGLMGAGRTELAMSLFGRSYGKRHSGKIFKDGVEVQLHSVSESISHGIAYLTEDRKNFGLVLIEDIKSNVSLASLQKVSKGQVINQGLENQAATDMQQQMRIRCTGHRPDRREPIRRQSAEGRPLQVDHGRARHTDPRRAHPRHRRRSQIRDLHDHQSPGLRGKIDYNDLLRDAGALGDVRQDIRRDGGRDLRGARPQGRLPRRAS